MARISFPTRFLKLTLLAVALGSVLLALAYFGLTRSGWDVEVRPPTESSFVFRADSDVADSGVYAPMSTQPVEDDGSPRPKNLVVLLADGLGFPHLVAARTGLVGAKGRLQVERFPVASWHTTFSADGMYTDSAAGATALATGVLTTPGSLAVDADGQPVPTIMEDALAAGKSVAVITDSYLWDASPAAWLVHHETRRDYDEIARQMAESGVSIAFGETRGEEEEALAPLLQPFRDAGFDMLLQPEDFERPWKGGQPRMSAFPPGSIADPDISPNLVDLADFALYRMMRDPEGFVLFVETEEVDSGAHNGDLDRVIRGLGALDEAARRILKVVGERDDTLVVFTGDHETGGLALANSGDGEPLKPMWAWGYHTGAPVPLLAWGAGAERLAGVHDNAEVGRILRELMTPAALSAAVPPEEP